MKARQVLKLLNISRITLYNYVKNGLIIATKLPNGYYDYDSKSVYGFLDKNIRINVVYARVSTYKQRNDLKRQINKIHDYCRKKNIKIDVTYLDISSGINFERKQFSELLDLVLNYRIDTIYVNNKDRLTRLSCITLESIFKKFGTNIYVINNSPNIQSDLFNEIVYIMHYFSTTEYSNRRKYKYI